MSSDAKYKQNPNQIVKNIAIKISSCDAVIGIPDWKLAAALA